MRALTPVIVCSALFVAGPAVADSSDCPADYLLVTSRDHLNDWRPLAQYRERHGYTIRMIAIEDVVAVEPGRDDAEKLRSYLQQFATQGGRLVLLAGDESNLPVRYTYHYDESEPISLLYQQLCDLYFADLTGDWDADGDNLWGEPTEDRPDLTPELLVGRLPLTDSADIAAYVDRIISYETHPGNGDDGYLERTLFVAADQMRDTPAGGQHGYIARAFPDWFAIDTTSAVEQPWGEALTPTGPSGRDIENALGTGYGIVQLLAHGRHDRLMVRTSVYNDFPKSYLWTGPREEDYGSITAAGSNGKPRFVYSLACETAGFDTEQPPFNYTGQHLCEAMLGADGGVVGLVGYSRDGWVTISYKLQKSFFDSLFAHPDDPAVLAMYRSHAANPWQRDLVYGQLFLGDPALRVYTRRPGWLAAEERLTSSLPDQVQLNPNYPNPFNPSTTISFGLPRRMSVSITIHNVLGQRVADLVAGELPAGEHRIDWDTREAALASGVYLARLATSESTQVQKLVLVR